MNHPVSTNKIWFSGRPVFSICLPTVFGANRLWKGYHKQFLRRMRSPTSSYVVSMLPLTIRLRVNMSTLTSSTYKFLFDRLFCPGFACLILRYGYSSIILFWLGCLNVAILFIRNLMVNESICYDQFSCVYVTFCFRVWNFLFTRFYPL
jgi:hypothetical protein